MSTKPVFKLSSVVPSFTEMPEYVTIINGETLQKGEVHYKIPRERVFGQLCNMVAVNPIFPRKSDNPMAEPLLLTGYGHTVSKRWLENSPLRLLANNFAAVHILSGSWDDDTKTFSYYGSGLNLQDYLLLRFMVDNETPRSDGDIEMLTSTLDKLSSLMVCGGTTENGYQMIVPLIQTTCDGEITVANEDDNACEWNNDIWKLAQLENYQLELSYDFINNGAAFRCAWVIDRDGDEVPAQIDEDCDRGVIKQHLHWPEVRSDDFCIFFEESSTSKLHVATSIIHADGLTCWQKRKAEEVLQYIAKKMNRIDTLVQVTMDDIMTACEDISPVNLISHVDE